MSKVHRLPADLANQIAAGEVVARPASVVKELIENAIDADARRVTIGIELGGKRTIRVEDDGVGLDAEDALLALERHATSKISRAEDLGAILTLGFRGEALPSIASVSRLRLRTRSRGSVVGTEIRVEAGAEPAVRQVGAPEGTLVEVSDLFFNLPARRKFLKSDTAEAAQVSRLVTQFALAYPEIGFTLTSAGRRLLECPPAGGLRERFFQIQGERPDLIEVQRDTAGIRVFGFVAALGDQGPVRGAQNVFVNRRIVKDRTIAHAVTAAYAVATIKERSPEVHLFIQMPPERVDVNVHPTKAEVRFLEQSLVHEVLRRAIQDALGQGRPPEMPFQLAGERPIDPGAVAQVLPGVMAGLGASPRWVPEASAVPAVPVAAPGDDVPSLRVAALGTPPATPLDPARQAMVDAVRPMIPLGQFRDTYIIAVDDEGVAIVDQHVAHERVLFEQVMERLTTGPLPSQRLLTPMLVELPPAQRHAIAAHAQDLERLGFDVEEFGGSSVRVSAIPALLGFESASAAVRALGDDLDGFERGGRVEDALRQLAATTACHAAVKANYRLTYDKMVHILDELKRTAYSTVCPHGRPVVLRLTRREIEKNFQRI
jgi:DNA mismatch repair protein MutL